MSSSLVLPARVVASMAERRRPNPFDKYGVREEIRERAPQPVLENSLVQRLRKAREMLRALPPEQALELIEFHNNLDFFEAVELAKRTGSLIVPHDVIDRISVYTNPKLPVSRTGTLVICEETDVEFTSRVIFGIYGSYSIKVPKEVIGKKNCAFTIDYPDFELVNNEIKILVDTKVIFSEFHIVGRRSKAICDLSCAYLGIPALPDDYVYVKNKLSVLGGHGGYVNLGVALLPIAALGETK